LPPKARENSKSQTFASSASYVSTTSGTDPRAASLKIATSVSQKLAVTSSKHEAVLDIDMDLPRPPAGVDAEDAAEVDAEADG